MLVLLPPYWLWNIIEGADTNAVNHAGRTALEETREYTWSADRKRDRNRAKYKAAFTDPAIAVTKLRFHRSLLEETVMLAMKAVDTRTRNGEDVILMQGDSRWDPTVELDASLLCQPGVTETVFSFLDDMERLSCNFRTFSSICSARSRLALKV